MEPVLLALALLHGQASRHAKAYYIYVLLMTRPFALLLLAAAIGVAAPVLAESQRQSKSAVASHKRSAKSGFQEVDGFLGLKFGVPLTSQLRPCIAPVYGEPAPARSFCYTGLSSGELGYAELEQAPDLGVAYSAAVLLWNGNVEDVCLRFRSEDFGRMLDLLTSRFGRPTVVDATVSEADAGQMLYEGKVYKWRGRRMSIELSEYADNAQESKAVFATNRYLQGLRH